MNSPSPTCAERLKVLFLSQPFLFPMDSGGKIRTGQLLDRLKDVFDITLVGNYDAAKNAPHLQQMKDLCREYHPIPKAEQVKYSLRFYLKILSRLFSRYPVTVIGDYAREIENKLLELDRRHGYDLLICDFLQPSLNFKNLLHRPTLLFQHNIESMIPRRHFEVTRNPFLKAFWWSQWRKMRKHERDTCRQFGGVVTVSESDRDLLKREFAIANVYAIPTGIDTEFFAPREAAVVPNSLVFTGSMDWLPNEDAILFFAKQILAKVKTRIPDVTLTVVGRKPSESLLKELKEYPEIKLTGWVEDVRPYISQHSLYIIPLRIGGGTRIKVYEAMAMGKAVVSTRIGVEGLPVVDGENVVLADSAEELAGAIVELLSDDRRRRAVEGKAREFVERNFSWEKAAHVFAEICRNVVATRRSAGSQVL